MHLLIFSLDSSTSSTIGKDTIRILQTHVELKKSNDCKSDVKFFPFDSQCCMLKFGSWSHHGGQVDITNRNTNIDLSTFVECGEFELVQVHQKRRVVKYSCFPKSTPTFDFTFWCDEKHNLILPCIMLSILSIAGFFLPPDSGEKGALQPCNSSVIVWSIAVALGITVLLFVLAICEKMPETSDSLPLIGFYLTTVMGLTTFSIVTTVVVLHFHHRGPLNEPCPQWMRELFLVRLRPLLRIRLPHLSTVRTSVPQTPTNPNSGQYRQGRRATLVESNGAVCRLDLSTSALKERPTDLYKRPLEEENNAETNHSSQLLRRSSSQTILHSLQELLRQQTEDNRQRRRAEEWRQIAEVIDRFLFFFFLVVTTVVTSLMLLFIPLWRNFFYDDQFDEQLFGLD